MSISHSNDNATHSAKVTKKKPMDCLSFAAVFFVETPQCDVCTEFVGAVVETRLIASLRFVRGVVETERAPSVAE